MNKVRLRLAPSPTGFLHLGNLRTALFGFLLAKKMGGDFILRIEDTDQKREVEGAVDSLIKVLDWVGITFDEGPHKGGDCGPYIQSQRLDIYKKHIDELLAEGKAYHCFCSAERLEEMRNEQAANKQAPRYDRACRNLSQEEVDKKIAAGEKFVIRQAMPLEGEVKVFDELRGEIVFKASDLEDHVLIKSDGVPTYQFASVVDDHLMGISHITRGEEWLPSFPKNVLLYQAFGWEVPKFIHLPLILNKTGGKLSKRQGDVFVEDYKAKGYLPEALINFCALLGWHPKNDKEIFTLDELKSEFNIEGLGASPAVFDIEKLDYYNGHYIRQKEINELTKLCLPYLTELENDNEKFKTIFGAEASFDFIKKVVALCF
jgi:nondiscriminating glutamyl-tRNA synthetase